MSEKTCKDCYYLDDNRCFKHGVFINDPENDSCTDFLNIETIDHNNIENIDKKDTINPSHYKQGKIECIEAIESATVNKKGIEAVCVANIVKYLWRYEEKNGLEDVQKCKWYLNRLIETLESKNND